MVDIFHNLVPSLLPLNILFNSMACNGFNLPLKNLKSIGTLTFTIKNQPKDFKRKLQTFKDPKNLKTLRTDSK